MLVQTLCSERRCELLGGGVDALQATLLLAREGLLDHLNLGMDERHLATKERWTTKDDIFAVLLNHLLNPLDASEPNQLHPARFVGCIDRKTLFAPLARKGLAHHSQSELDVCRGVILGHLGDLVGTRAVDISEWEMVEHIAHSDNAKLLLQQLGPRFAYALHKLYRIIEQISHLSERKTI